MIDHFIFQGPMLCAETKLGVEMTRSIITTRWEAGKVRMYEEIMMNDDNLESNLLTSSLLKMCCLVQARLQVELEMLTAQ